MQLANSPLQSMPRFSALAYPMGPVGSLQTIPPYATSQSKDAFSFTQLQQQLVRPSLSITTSEKNQLFVRHPWLTRTLKASNLVANGNQDFGLTLKMYTAIYTKLDSNGKAQLKKLLDQGILANAKTDDGRSTLYHLYAMATTPRGSGYDQQKILRETVAKLSEPYTITQKFSPLSQQAAAQMMKKEMETNRSGKPVKWEDLNVTSSATCVSSSVMYYMAEKEPGEFARHMNELTSPLHAFYEKARLDEISPDNPQLALDILRNNNIEFTMSNAQEVLIKVPNPPTGIIRALDAQKNPASNNKERNAIETAYQSALTHLATASYDPGTDLRDSETPGETSKGLTEAEKSLIETIVKDNGGVQSVTYQAVSGKSNPQADEEGNSYLYGYKRSFERTAADLIEALKMGEFIIIGITDTDASGSITGGHEITITGASINKQTGELEFTVADSDDNIPTLVTRSARELIPRIHHAGMPLQLARKIHQEQQQNASSYFVPDHNDAKRFTLLAYNAEPMPAEFQEEPAAASVASAPPQTTLPPTAAFPSYAVPPVPVTPANYQVNNPFINRYPTNTPFPLPQQAIPQAVSSAA